MLRGSEGNSQTMGKRVLGTRCSRLGQEAAVRHGCSKTGVEKVLSSVRPAAQSLKLPLQHWSIHLWPSCPEYPKDFSVKQATFSLQGSGVNFPVSCLSSMGNILSAVEVKTVLAQCHLATFDAHSTGHSSLLIFFAVKWRCCQEQTCLLVRTGLSLINHL